MKKLLYPLITACILVLFFTTSLNAQQKIKLLNGKTINPTSYSIGEMFVNYKLEGDNPKKLRLVDKYDVFSVTNSENQEDILYKPVDSLDFSIEDARFYMDGENAARSYFNKPGVRISAAGVGLASGVLSFYSLPIPFFYGIAITQRNPRKCSCLKSLKTWKTTKPFDLATTGKQEM
jgi:hypothetical protein